MVLLLEIAIGIVLTVVASIIILHVTVSLEVKMFNYWSLLALLVVYILINAFMYFSPKRKFYEPVPLEVARNCEIENRFSEEPYIAKLKKGETVKLYGYTEKLDLLVETENGVRGYVPAYKFGLPLNHKYKKDKKREYEIYTYVREKQIKYDNGDIENQQIFKNSKGEEVEGKYLWTSNYQPVYPEGIKTHTIKEYNLFHFSKEKFKQLCVGKTLSEIEAHLCSATVVTKKEAVFANIIVFDFETNTVFKPSVIFDEEMKFSDIGKYKVKEIKVKKINLIQYIKRVPGFKAVMDSEFPSRIFTQSLYYPYVFDKLSQVQEVHWYSYVLAILYILVRFVIVDSLWFFSFLIPVIILMLAAKCRYTYILLNNKWLARFFRLIIWPSAYLWWLVLTAINLQFGLLWTALIVATGHAFAVGISDVFNHQFIRCNHCKRMHKMKEDRVELIKEWEEWHKETEEELLGKDNVHTGDSWTQVTEKSAYSTSTHRENIKHHYTETRTYRVYHYDVLYNFKEFKRIYKCSVCSSEEFETFTKQKEIDRKLTHTSIETRSHSYKTSGLV